MEKKEYAVCDILQKEDYNESSQFKLEDMYNHGKGTVKEAGSVTVDDNTVPAMEISPNTKVEVSSETFLIWSNFIHSGK